MQSLLLKLQADVEARKNPRSIDVQGALKSILFGLLVFLVAFQLGARSATYGEEWNPASLAAVTLPDGELDFQKMQVEKLRSAYQHSAKYGIPADLAASIEEIALSEGIDVKLAFELVRVESRFYQRAVSPVGALGYTQLMPATARLLQPGITRDQIFDRETNLRLGFRFLKSLIVKYDGDTKLALLAYNRGPNRVDELRRMGIDPNNGYVQLVMGR